MRNDPKRVLEQIDRENFEAGEDAYTQAAYQALVQNSITSGHVDQIGAGLDFLLRAACSSLAEITTIRCLRMD